jgi:hypothetical protein
MHFWSVSIPLGKTEQRQESLSLVRYLIVTGCQKQLHRSNIQSYCIFDRILKEHLRSPPVFSGVRVTRSLALWVCLVDRCLSFCLFSFDHFVVCSSSIYGFWLSLWYLQSLLIKSVNILSFFNGYVQPLTQSSTCWMWSIFGRTRCRRFIGFASIYHTHDMYSK